jgi:hypothetical protein
MDTPLRNRKDRAKKKWRGNGLAIHGKTISPIISCHNSSFGFIVLRRPEVLETFDAKFTHCEVARQGGSRDLSQFCKQLAAERLAAIA